MRQIKFRAWDKQDEKMYYPEQKVFCIDLSGNIRQHPSLGVIDDVVLLQFTGMLDINGKEIYEGDIVSFEHVAGYEIENSKIFWDDETSSFSCNFKIKNSYNFHNSTVGNLSNDCKALKIIGNIYENKDLIK